MILGLVFALIIGAPRLDSRSTESQATKQQAHDEYEDTSNQPFASMNWPGEFTQKPTPVPSCRKSRVSSQKNCPRLGPAAVFVSELPTLSMSRFAIGGVASLMNVAPRPTHSNVLPVRSRLRCRVVGPVLAHCFRAVRHPGGRSKELQFPGL
jgi:hypothetical protein